MNRVSDPPPPADFAASWGALVVGHGTRSSVGLAEYHEVVALLARRLAPLPVEAGFLELAEPTIDAGLERLAARGARRIVVMPLLLFAAGHAKQDIPQAVAASSVVRIESLAWVQTEPLGLAPDVVGLSALRFDEAIADTTTAATSAAEAALPILVGRGSTDPEALAAMRDFVRLREAARPTDAPIELAYTALAEPLLETVLERAGGSAYRRIVVQPHLLFHGELVDRIERQTAEAAHRFPEKQWIVAGRLGPHEQIVAAAARRISTAVQFTNS